MSCPRGIHRLRRIALTVAVAVGVGWPGGANAQAAERVFELRIEGGEVAPDMRTLRVTQGDNVRLRWTTDAPTILHLHGYDIEQEVTPGQVTEMQLEAYATGRYPLEVHASAHAGHEAPLLFLEVHPR